MPLVTQDTVGLLDFLVAVGIQDIVASPVGPVFPDGLVGQVSQDSAALAVSLASQVQVAILGTVVFPGGLASQDSVASVESLASQV